MPPLWQTSERVSQVWYLSYLLPEPGGQRIDSGSQESKLVSQSLVLSQEKLVGMQGTIAL